MVTLGSALLCVGTAWLQGVAGGMLELATSSAGHVRVVQQEYADLERMMPIYLNVMEAQKLADEIQAVDGVKGAYPRIALGTTITKTEVIGDHFALVLGAPVGLYEHEYRLKEQMEAGGGWFEGPDDLLVGRKVKEQLGLQLGEEVVMNGMTQDGSFSAVKGRVVGFVRGDNPVQERQVFMSLERLQYLADMPGAATEILVYGEHRDQARRLAQGMQALPSLKQIMIEEDTRWEADTEVDGHLFVQEGATLTLSPGVTVQMKPNSSLNIAGSLVSEGTADALVTFKSSESASLCLNIMDGEKSQLQHTQLEGVQINIEGSAEDQVDSCMFKDEMLVQPWSEREPWAGMVAMMSVITYIIIIIIVFITSLGVWNTMTISVMERTGEIGVLRALGMKRMAAVSLFVMEAMMIGIIGGVLGVLLGGLPAYYLEVVGVSIPENVVENMDVPFQTTIRADLNAFVVWVTFMTAAAMAFLGSALPALRAALIQPVEAMRARR